MPPLSQHRRLGQKRPRHAEESSSRRPRRSPPRPHSRKNRRRERTVDGSTSAAQERSRTSAPGRGPTTGGRETCIDLTAEPLTPGPAVVDLTDTPVQLQRREPIRRDSSDVEITGTEKKTMCVRRTVVGRSGSCGYCMPSLLTERLQPGASYGVRSALTWAQR